MICQTEYLSVRMFADDMTLNVSGKLISELQVIINYVIKLTLIKCMMTLRKQTIVKSYQN